jgi:DNA-binding NtrC family response regulator
VAGRVRDASWKSLDEAAVMPFSPPGSATISSRLPADGGLGVGAGSFVDIDRQQTGTGFFAPLRSQRPRYFHLLWEEDLDDLAPVLRAVRDRRAEVVRAWYSLYVRHFGDVRTVTEAEFTAIFEPALARNNDHLLRKDIESYTREMLRLGDQLAQRQLPLRELIAALYLFEEAAQSVFPADLPGDIRLKFDKLSHIRIILLVESYARARVPLDFTRIDALESEAPRLGPHERTGFHGMVGKSEPMRLLFELIEAAGQTRGTILVVGESGSGKELVARAVHECGSEANRPFVALNCAALPKELIESELFGYKRGAFSGANSEYLGLFRAADRGTLLLDEITEMGAETQSKLLRAIQERAVRPVGSTHEVQVSARIIATTNRDPLEAVHRGRLREDLYYRLQASVIRVPPLRERREDIALLAEYFVDRFNRQKLRQMPVMGIDADAMAAMVAYSWPGNVRELSNSIEGAFTFGRSTTIGLSDLAACVISGDASVDSLPVISPHVLSFTEVECDLIRRALSVTKGNRSQAAKLLKISRKRLYAKMAKYDLS